MVRLKHFSMGEVTMTLLTRKDLIVDSVFVFVIVLRSNRQSSTVAVLVGDRLRFWFQRMLKKFNVVMPTFPQGFYKQMTIRVRGEQ